MENRINEVMELSDGRKYIIIKQAIYKNENYFLANGITKDEQDVTEDVKFFHEVKKDNQNFVEEVKDQKLLQLIATYLGFGTKE